MSSSPVSSAIAQYYAQKRGITNIVAITCQQRDLWRLLPGAELRRSHGSDKYL